MIEVVAYFAILAVWSAVVAYLIVFIGIPLMRGKKVHHHATHAPAHAPAPAPSARAVSPNYSTHEGFKSFARGNELTVDDIVKGLSREGRD